MEIGYTILPPKIVDKVSAPCENCIKFKRFLFVKDIARQSGWRLPGYVWEYEKRQRRPQGRTSRQGHLHEVDKFNADRDKKRRSGRSPVSSSPCDRCRDDLRSESFDLFKPVKKHSAGGTSAKEDEPHQRCAVAVHCRNRQTLWKRDGWIGPKSPPEISCR